MDNPTISFTKEDARQLHHPHDNALDISLSIVYFNTRRVLVDNGSLADILYYPTFQQIKVNKECLLPSDTQLVEFSGTKFFPLRTITLLVTIRTYPQQLTKETNFLVVDCSSAYNTTIGRLTLNAWKVATSTYYLLVKFSTKYGIGEARGD